MINIYTQAFWERSSGKKHDVAINFGWINPMSNGHYEVTVDGSTESCYKHKNGAFGRVTELIAQNDWAGVNRREA